MEFTPTDEQRRAIDLFLTGENLAIEAGAGAGKTSTLKLIAATDPTRLGAYVAFNRSIVDEAKAKMPQNVTASTVHSLAMRAVGTRYRHRLGGARVRANELARLVGCDRFVVEYGSQRKTLAAGWVAGLAMRSISRFCQSADPIPTRRHVPYVDGIDLPTLDGRRTYGNNDRLAAYLEPFLTRIWADLIDPAGRLPYKHEHYLKLWERSAPRIQADYLLVDEAQDLSPIMLSIAEQQIPHGTQIVLVGDSQQQIYEFTGAVNAIATALETGLAENRTFLTQSWRFGHAIADAANLVLDRIGAELRISGTPSIDSWLGPIEQPDAILTRTNAQAVSLMLGAIRDGRRPCLIGGADEVVSFARGAKSLQDEGWTGHPELSCFQSWDEVVDYVDNDQQGDELRLLVKLVDEYGADVIVEGLNGTTTEARADLVVSTAHKSKGREWSTVQLAGDFPDPEQRDLSPADLRLIYVAVTRAQVGLDVTRVGLFSQNGADQ